MACESNFVGRSRKVVMSIQTEAMRTGAKKQQCVCRDDNGYYGAEFVCHPSPSGFERWLPTYSDKRRFKTDQEAAVEFKRLMARLDNIESRKSSYNSRVKQGANHPHARKRTS